MQALFLMPFEGKPQLLKVYGVCRFLGCLFGRFSFHNCARSDCGFFQLLAYAGFHPHSTFSSLVQFPKHFCAQFGIPGDCGLCTERKLGRYRAEKKSLQILLSRTQAGPGRKVKQQQEESSRNHVPRLFLGSVQPRTRMAYGHSDRE